MQGGRGVSAPRSVHVMLRGWKMNVVLQEYACIQREGGRCEVCQQLAMGSFFFLWRNQRGRQPLSQHVFIWGGGLA